MVYRQVILYAWTKNGDIEGYLVDNNKETHSE